MKYYVIARRPLADEAISLIDIEIASGAVHPRNDGSKDSARPLMALLMTQYAFYFDSAACSGCKACQAACKDKHHLPVGLSWRRVYEITGGGWTRSGEAWITDVFAYNLSIACNHCVQPICVEVCPTRAMHKRADGIVSVDQDKCAGCRYCSWACPYDAPQYDEVCGHMTKCDFCADNLERGLPPACVAACPLRALDFGELSELQARHGATSDMLPLPKDNLTHPELVINPHPVSGQRAWLGNADEVGARSGGAMKERSLVIFTLLSQMVVGTLWMLSVLNGLNVTTSLLLTAIMVVALGVSFFHLGSPRRAWRAISGWRSSWLSREVLCASLFTASLGGLTLAAAMKIDLQTGGWIASVCGLALLISMTQAYRLRTVPEWDRWTTTASFFSTALLLGSVCCGALIDGGPWLILGAIGLVCVRQAFGWNVPGVLLLRVMIVVALLLTLAVPGGWWAALALSLIAEARARSTFYERRASLGAWRFSSW